MGEGISTAPGPLAILFHQMGKGETMRHWYSSPSRGTGSIIKKKKKKKAPSLRKRDVFLSPYLIIIFIKAYLLSSFSQYIMNALQQKNYRAY